MQVEFLLARELGYCYFDIKDRSITSTPDRVRSFQQVLNDFRASYFAGALLMPRAAMINDLEAFFEQKTWDPQPLLDMLDRYGATPEMLLYHFSELIPQFFGLPIHFLRFHHTDGKYRLYKRLNMSQLLLQSGIGLNEHHCRRWLSLRLLKDLDEGAESANPKSPVSNFQSTPPLVGVHISEFLDSRERYLGIGFARPLVLSPNVSSSVVVGFQVTPGLKNTIRFVEDPTIQHVIINETCER